MEFLIFLAIAVFVLVRILSRAAMQVTKPQQGQQVSVKTDSFSLAEDAQTQHNASVELPKPEPVQEPLQPQLPEQTIVIHNSVPATTPLSQNELRNAMLLAQVLGKRGGRSHSV